MELMSAIAIDIETVANQSMLDRLPGVEVDPRLKDESKIAADIERKRQKQIDDMALNPLTGRICAFATATAEISTSYAVAGLSDADEKNLLKALSTYLSNEYSRIVTFNGYSFDIPFIYKRLMIHRVAPGHPMSYYLKRYDTNKHCDLRMVLSDWDKYASGSLEYYADLLLNEHREDLDYKLFESMIANGEAQKIADGCKSHAELTLKLYSFCQGWLF